MPAAKFRKKPVVIEAIRFIGDNLEEVEAFAPSRFHEVDPEDRLDDPDIVAEVFDTYHSTWIGVKVGQWVIRGTQGEYYPCDDETFQEIYEEV